MEAAFIHEGAGHDHIVAEMAGEEPVVGVDVGFGADLAESVAAALGFDGEDAVDEFHAAAREGERVGDGEIRELVAEAAGEIAGAKGVEPGVGDGFVGEGDDVAPVGR